MDASRDDGRNPYCKSCIRNRRNNETAEKNARGLSARGSLLYLNESERAIERERHKRRIEKEIEISLKDSSESKPEFNSSVSVWAGLVPQKKGKGSYSWTVR